MEYASVANTILCVDLGSTDFKCAIIVVANGSYPSIKKVIRLRVNLASWPVEEATERLEESITRICEIMRQVASEASPQVASLTGVREGLALIHPDGSLIRAVSNAEAILWQTRFGNNWIVAVAEAERASEWLAASLQGWLAFTLTGTLSITECETRSWLVDMETGSEEASTALGVSLPPVVPIGATIGRSSMVGDVPVLIAGTDECASHYGVGLGHGTGTELGTGTYWSLSRAVPTSGYTPGKRVRIVPAMSPYPAIASFVGYHWGEYILEILEHRQPIVKENLPIWGASKFISGLREGRVTTREQAIAFICEDLLEACQMLPEPPDGSKSELVVHGGGLAQNNVAREVAGTLGWRPYYMIDDPTLVGSALVAVRGRHTNFTSVLGTS